MSAIDKTKIDDDRVSLLLALEENHFNDLKSKDIQPSKLTKSISAFANTSGGELYIGIDENDVDGKKIRSWNGFSDIEEANGHLQAVEEVSPLSNHYEATFLENDNQTGLVLQINVLKTNGIIYDTKQVPYSRRGAQSLPVKSDEAVQRLRLDKGLVSFEDEKVNDADIEDIANSITIIKFLLNIIPDTEPETWLKKQRLIKDGTPTVAGILLFSEEPQALIPKRSAVKIYRYKSSDEEGERDTLVFDPITIEGDLYSLIYATVAKTKELIQNLEKLGVSGLVNIEYPEEALMEIITNAVLHRDYSLPVDIHIRIFDNRIEIENPGKLPGHITLGNILNEQFARNPKLVRLINKFPDAPNKDVGEGLNTAYEAMTKLRLKPPIIEEKENSVQVILRHEPLASPEQSVMEYLENHGEITNSIARELTGIKSENSMKDVFYRLRDRKMIEQVPEKKGRASAWRKFTS